MWCLFIIYFYSGFIFPGDVNVHDYFHMTFFIIHFHVIFTRFILHKSMWFPFFRCDFLLWMIFFMRSHFILCIFLCEHFFFHMNLKSLWFSHKGPSTLTRSSNPHIRLCYLLNPWIAVHFLLVQKATLVYIKPLISFPFLCSDTAVTYLKMDNNMVSTTQLLPPVSSETNGDQGENFTLSVFPWIVWQ